MQENHCYLASSKPIFKKESGLFHVTMGAYDGAEVCELSDNFLLYALSLKYNETRAYAGLYRFIQK